MEVTIAKKPKKKFNIYGTPVELSYPTVDQMISLTEGTDDTKPRVEQLKAMKSLVVSLGMPSDVAGECDFEDFTTVISEVTGASKKK